MNFIFFSVHFPDFIRHFSYHLRQAGANVLGIGDTDYQALDDRLKGSLTDYYKVDNLENYDEVIRAVGYFTFKYGKIDRIESLNEHWLEMEAQIRMDFNIEGVKPDEIENFRRKSRMKQFFKKSVVKTIPYIHGLTGEKIKEFAARQGFPVIVKPDKGSGANMTFKLTDESEIDEFIHNVPDHADFIAEKFVDGIIVTYDGLTGRDGEVLFESSTTYEQSIMDVVNHDNHVHYVTMAQIPEDVRDAGRKIMKAYGAKEKFFHIELFRSRKNQEIIALEVNMRPPGAWMTDAINFTHDMDIYREWANMIMRGEIGGPFTGKYFTAYASRKSHKDYLIGHAKVIDQLNGKLVRHEAIAPVLSRAMGNYAYQFRSESLEEVRQLIKMIHEERPHED